MTRVIRVALTAGCLISFGLVVSPGAASAATPIQLVLPGGPAFAVLGHSCGGIQQQTYATGFDVATGYPAGEAYLQTTCSSGGRGSHPTTYHGYASTLWDFTGALISYSALSSAPPFNPTLTAFDTHLNEVSNSSGHAYLVLGSGYTPVPRLTGMTPNFGPASGGTTVTLTGTGFTGASAVDFGGIAASPPTVVSDTSITAVSPVSLAGMVHVSVTTPGGTDVSSSVDQFTFYARPTVSGVTPNSGPINGGTTVTITGTGFVGATAVSFGDTQGGFFVDNDTTITAVSPGEGSPDNVSVTVVSPGGTSPITGANQQFTYSTSTGCGGSCVSTVYCAKLTGTLNGIMSLSRCAPRVASDKKASGTAAGTFTWTPSGETTMMSLNAPIPVGQGGCPVGRTEYDLTGSVSGGTSTYTVVGDAVAARACVTKSGRLSLVSGTTFGL